MHYKFNSYRIESQEALSSHVHSHVDLYNDHEFAGSVCFMKDGEHIPKNVIEEDGTPRLFYPESRSKEMYHMLHHKMPLYISIDPETGVGAISETEELILV